MVAPAWRSHGHAEGSVVAADAVVDRDGDGEDASRRDRYGTWEAGCLRWRR